MKNNRKEFIKDLHNNVNDELKEQIELEFPKLFKKDDFIVGEWYKNLTHKGSLFCFRFKNKYTLKGEGFDYLGVYCKRGCWGANIIDLDGDRPNSIRYNAVYYLESNTLWSKYGKVFQNGKWAEIVATITKEEAEKQLGKTIID